MHLEALLHLQHRLSRVQRALHVGQLAHLPGQQGKDAHRVLSAAQHAVDGLLGLLHISGQQVVHQLEHVVFRRGGNDGAHVVVGDLTALVAQIGGELFQLSGEARELPSRHKGQGVERLGGELLAGALQLCRAPSGQLCVAQRLKIYHDGLLFQQCGHLLLAVGAGAHVKDERAPRRGIVQPALHPLDLAVLVLRLPGEQGRPVPHGDDAPLAHHGQGLRGVGDLLRADALEHHVVQRLQPRRQKGLPEPGQRLQLHIFLGAGEQIDGRDLAGLQRLIELTPGHRMPPNTNRCASRLPRGAA